MADIQLLRKRAILMTENVWVELEEAACVLTITRLVVG